MATPAATEAVDRCKAMDASEDFGHPHTEVVRASDYDALLQKLARLEQDAARYRWLRLNAFTDRHEISGEPWVTFEIYCIEGGPEATHEALDAAIDAALAKDAPCANCHGSGLVTIHDYDGNGSDADDQPCADCADIRAALQPAAAGTEGR